MSRIDDSDDEAVFVACIQEVDDLVRRRLRRYPPFFAGLDRKKGTEAKFNSFTAGEALREPIFYGGESAYSFQYRDFAVRKYQKDDEWLQAHKGFSMGVARDIVRAVGQLGDEKAVATIGEMMSRQPDQPTILPAYEFTVQEVSQRLRMSEELVARVLSTFVVPENDRNSAFTALNEFNIANAKPLLRFGDRFILFQIYSFAEALYDAPFYWMSADKTYVATSMHNRGLFTEEFSVERLAPIFGVDKVYSNVDIVESKGKKVGEIDVLVIFGNRAIVLQAKSKRLTLEAKKGNDGQIKNDFKMSVQDAYDQGLNCAKLLLERRYMYTDGQGRNVDVPAIKDAYILCVLSDHYPALSFQARQFLKVETSEAIPPPFVLDVFTLDAMTEMLGTPLLLLSYIDRRVKYSDKIMSAHELTILAYHIKQNLWLGGEYDVVMLEDDIGADLDLAMIARREGIPGKKTPEGILTGIRTTTFGRLLQEIEARPDPKTIDLGFFLLTVSGDSVREISRGIDALAAIAKADGKNHDMTLAFDAAATGLTVHCNNDSLGKAIPRLEAHCHIRKYSRKARTWFGICIEPNDMSVSFGINLQFPWERDDAMEAAVNAMPKSRELTEVTGGLAGRAESKRKRRRNEPCICGGGKKYKKCCGKEDG